MSALAELDAAITRLRLAWDLSREEADHLQREAIVTRDAHPGLLCGADLLAQMDVPEHLKPRLFEALAEGHREAKAAEQEAERQRTLVRAAREEEQWRRYIEEVYRVDLAPGEPLLGVNGKPLGMRWPYRGER